MRRKREAGQAWYVVYILRYGKADPVHFPRDALYKFTGGTPSPFRLDDGCNVHVVLDVSQYTFQIVERLAMFLRRHLGKVLQFPAHRRQVRRMRNTKQIPSRLATLEGH